MKEKITKQYGKNPKESLDFGRIINHRHFDRICGIMDEVKDCTVYGGSRDRESRYISPTIVVNPSLDKRIMKEEVNYI